MRRKTAFEIFASECAHKQCMGRTLKWLRNMIEALVVFKRSQSRKTTVTLNNHIFLYSAAESRRLKRVASPAEPAPLAHRAADLPDAVDGPADAIVPAGRMQKGRREAQGDDASGRGRGRRIQDEEKSRFPITAKSFHEACSRPGHSFRKESQAFMKETMDVVRSEEKSPPDSFPCAHEVDIGTCGAFDTDLQASLSASANHYATDHKVSKITCSPSCAR